MKSILLTFPLLAAMALPAAGETCPPPLEFEDRKADLLTTLQDTRNEDAGRFLTRELLALWATAPDRVSQRLLDLGMELREAEDYIGAFAALSDLIAYCPEYAEGYNQRAFVRYLSRDYAGAIEDLDAALEREPQHAAAMAGRAMSLMQLGRVDESRRQLKEALSLNPWLPERRLLSDPPGETV